MGLEGVGWGGGSWRCPPALRALFFCPRLCNWVRVRVRVSCVTGRCDLRPFSGHVTGCCTQLWHLFHVQVAAELVGESDR